MTTQAGGAHLIIVASGAEISLVDDEGFTLHRRLWQLNRRLPRLVQVWIVLAVIGAFVFELRSLFSGTSQTERVRDAVTAAVREAAGSDLPAAASRWLRLALLRS